MLHSQVANEDWSEVALKFPATEVTVMIKILPGFKPVKLAEVIAVMLLYKGINPPFEMFTT